MDRDDVMARCAGKPGAVQDHPWGPGDSVWKVGGKIFAFLGGDDADGGTFKCDALRVDEWRSRYPDHIGRAPYLGSKPWNRVVYAGVDPDDLAEIVDDSYQAVVATLAKSRRPPGWDQTRP